MFSSSLASCSPLEGPLEGPPEGPLERMATTLPAKPLVTTSLAQEFPGNLTANRRPVPEPRLTQPMPALSKAAITSQTQTTAVWHS